MDRNTCQEIIDTGLFFELSSAKVMMMIDDVELGGLWGEDDFVLDSKPVVQCPSCHGKLDTNEQCRACGWGIHYSEGCYNLAEADCGC